MVQGHVYIIVRILMHVHNNWTQKEMGLYLAILLRGHAQGVLGNLASTHKHDYDLLVYSLEERFAPSNQNVRYILCRILQ